MAPKSKLILIMAALSLRKKKICALALLVMLDKVENEGTGRRFWVRKIFQERENTVFMAARTCTKLWHCFTTELEINDSQRFIE